jgi:Flp pilus assembly protein TadD
MSSDNSGEPATPKPVTLGNAILTAQHFQRSSNLEPAEAIYHEILRLIPEEPNALHFLGVLRHQQGRNGEAIELIRRAAARLPGDSGPWLNLGNVLLETERYDDAVDAYKQAAEYAPNNVLIYSNLGLLHARRDCFDLAETCYRHGLSLAPKAENVLHNYARMLQRQGRYEEAVAYNIKSLDINPNDPKARRMLSMSHALLGDMDAARGVLREAGTPRLPRAATGG